MPWANAVNCAATVAALTQFIAARLRRRTIAWRKTEHVYPQRPVPGYSPVTFNATAGTFPEDVTVKAAQTTAPGIFPTGQAITRYWTLTVP